MFYQVGRLAFPATVDEPAAGRTITLDGEGMDVGTDIEELAVVELTRELEGFEGGAIGTVVSARPEHDLYTVEVADAKGRTVGLVSATSGDLRVRHRPGLGLAG